MQLPSPQQIKLEYPLPNPGRIATWRRIARQILERSDPRRVAIVGPCSVHDPRSASEYALRLKTLSEEMEGSFFFIMRLFFEKARTRFGWKGMLYDPYLDGSQDLEEGIRASRSLCIQIAELGVPCAMELLEPLLLPYFDDLIVWGLIGARTSASQPHRQMASGCPFPVGFKNDPYGGIDTAIDGILVAQSPHTHFGIDSTGRIASVQTPGNPLAHLVLRGSHKEPNYDPASVELSLSFLRQEQLPERLLIDCSHGNSGKNPARQKIAFEAVLEQLDANAAIAGLMLESHLFSGSQPLRENALHYGVSVTDPCLGWEETASLFQSMSRVQKWCSHV